MVARGEVWWWEASEHGRRPALVLTRDEAIEVLHRVVVVPATRTVRGIPSEVPLDHDDGMPQACALSLDNLTVAPKALLTRRITRLGLDRMAQVCGALRHATGY